MRRSRLIEVPLGIELWFPKGQCRCHDYSDLPCRRVVAALAQAHLGVVKPRGTISSPAASSGYAGTISSFATALHRRGFTGGLEDLDPDTFVSILEELHPKRKLFLKRLVRGAQPHLARPLNPGVAAVAHARTPGVSLACQPVRPVRPISHGEEQRLVAACKIEIEALEQRLAETVERLRDAEDPRGIGKPREIDVLWLLDRIGPRKWWQIQDLCGMHRAATVYVLGRTYRDLLGQLFPSRRNLVPFMLLFGLRTGLPPECLTTLNADDLELLGDGKAMLHWTKARAVGRESSTFGAVGQWSPGHLFGRALAVTERSRRHADPEIARRLWICVESKGSNGGLPSLRLTGWGFETTAFLRDHDLRDDDGAPLRLDRRRLRKAHYAKLDKAYGGLVNIIAAPNQSPRVAGDNYLSVTTPTETIEQVIEATQNGLLQTARRSRPTVLSAADSSELTDDVEQAAAVLGLDPDRAASLLGTDAEDLYAAKCKDFDHAPHGVAGEPCRAPEWQCMVCENAVVTPEKLPNLLGLLDFVSAQHDLLPALEWERRFGTIERAIRVDVLPAYSDTEIADARTKHSDDALYVSPELQAP